VLSDYGFLTHHSRDIIVLVRKEDGRIIEANPAAVQHYGYSRDEILSLTIADLRAPAARPQMQQDLAKADATGSLFETIHCRKDGSEFPVELNSQGTTFGGQRVLLSIVRDITDRKRLEAELQESEERYRVFFNMAVVGMVQAEPMTGRLLDVNPKFCQMTGYTREELLGMGFPEITHPEDRQRDFASFQQMVRGETAAHISEKRYLRKDGTVLWGQVHASLLRNASGQPVKAVAVVLDTSIRKQAEESLRQSQSRLEFLIRHAPAAIAMFDTDMRYLMASNRWLEDYGLTGQDFLGRSHYDLFPELPERWKDINRRCLAGAVERCEADPFVRADGTTQWVRWEIQPWFEANGKQGGIFILAEEITESHEAQQQLANVHRRLEAIMRAVPVGISYSTDPANEQVTGNPTVLAQFEVQPVDNLSASAPDSAAPGRQVRFYKEGRPITDKELPLQRAVAENREIPPMELEVELPSGKRWIAEASGAPVHNEHGEVIGGVAVTVDITARKKAEQELYGALQRLQSHMANSPVAIIEFDTDMKIRLWTDAAQQVFGWRAEEVVGKNLWDIPWIHPEDREKVQRVSTALVGRQEARNVSPNRNLRSDGSTIYCEWYNSSIHDSQGQLVSVFSLALDVTERVHAQQAMQQAKEEAERASQAKDHFLAVLSHELRTPLTPVLTTAQIMENDASLSPEQQDCVQMIRRNVELEARLIDDLLDLTRISRGKLELHFATVDLHQRLQHVLAMCDEDIVAKKLVVTVETQAVRNHVPADPARLQQILWNLVKNAVKFTPVAGRITIRTENTNAEHVVVSVQDTGVGIEPELLPRLFNAFEQGGKDVTRQFGGLGLGLAISKGLVDLYGGTLTATSEGKGHGATFTLTLRTTSPTPSHRPVGGTDLAFRTLAEKRRVLLVEDHPDTAKVMSGLLRSYGFTVTLARCVQEAVQAIHDGSFDLLLSDVGLPDGSGLDLMRQVAAIRPMKAIALSGFGMEEDIRKSKEAGFMAHLTKPVDLKALEQVLSEVLAAG